jgi:hypothetical protein
LVNDFNILVTLGLVDASLFRALTRSVLVERLDDGGADELGLVSLVRNEIQTHGQNLGWHNSEMQVPRNVPSSFTSPAPIVTDCSSLWSLCPYRSAY